MCSLAERPIQATRSLWRAGSGTRRCASTRASSSVKGSAPALEHVHMDSRYVARYHNPASHESAPLPRKLPGLNGFTNAGPGSSAGSSSISSPLDALEQHGRHESENRRRLSGETDNGSFRSTPSAKARKTALLFPGSGSQYVGMCQFLNDNFQAAREVWEEAEDVSPAADFRFHQIFARAFVIMCY